MVGVQDTKSRCKWVDFKDPLYLDYHDIEWGKPLHDDRKLFEFLILEGAQAGLSWKTILHRRESYRAAFSGFEAEVIAEYGTDDISRLMLDTGIIRNRLKINAAVNNAYRFIKVQDEFGSFDTYIWGFVDGKPLKNKRTSIEEIPASTSLSDQMSKDLKKRGFSFVGSTICYSFMQAVGIVNDHTVDCFRYTEA